MAKEAHASLWDRLLEATRSSVGWSGTPAQQHPAGDPEPVRAAMRSLLPQAGSGRQAVRVGLAIHRSRDLHGLWYLRAPLMQAIARERGEQHAHTVVAGLDPLFREAWPQAPLSRRSALG
jgi:hypothetical protein